MDFALLQSLAIATGLGLLVGLQREWQSERPAGIRTFTLITISGTLCAAFPGRLGEWMLPAGLLSVAAILWLGKRMAEPVSGAEKHGITTEIAALVMFLVGAMLVDGQKGAALVVTGLTAVLLHWKVPLHAFARRIGAEEFRAIIQFVLVALVLLPALPNQAYGPYGVLNPFKIWLMVTLIVGINLISYVVHRWLGESKGALIAGLLGGMISSTATTVSHAKQTSGFQISTGAAAVVIVIASAIVNIRVLIEIAVIGPGLLRQAVPPFVILGLFMGACGIYLARRESTASTAEMQHTNPAQVKTALWFGALFAAVIFVMAALKVRFGLNAVYAVALVSGLTDVDAITLSASDLFQSGHLTPEDAWRVILVASLSNLVFKVGITAVFGARLLLRKVAVVTALTVVLGAALVRWWPDELVSAF